MKKQLPIILLMMFLVGCASNNVNTSFSSSSDVESSSILPSSTSIEPSSYEEFALFDFTKDLSITSQLVDISFICTLVLLLPKAIVQRTLPNPQQHSL